MSRCQSKNLAFYTLKDAKSRLGKKIFWQPNLYIWPLRMKTWYTFSRDISLIIGEVSPLDFFTYVTVLIQIRLVTIYFWVFSLQTYICTNSHIVFVKCVCVCVCEGFAIKFIIIIINTNVFSCLAPLHMLVELQVINIIFYRNFYPQYYPLGGWILKNITLYIYFD